jgi:hypothetical protein
MARGQQSLTGDGQRIALEPALDLVVGPVLGGIGLRVAEVAVRPTLEQRRSAAIAGSVDRLHGGLTYGPQVVPVDDRERDPVGAGAGRDLGPGGDLLHRCEFAVEVVLADEDRG